MTRQRPAPRLRIVRAPAGVDTEMVAGQRPRLTVVGMDTNPASAPDAHHVRLVAHTHDGTPIDWHDMVDALWAGELDPEAVIVDAIPDASD